MQVERKPSCYWKSSRDISTYCTLDNLILSSRVRYFLAESRSATTLKPVMSTNCGRRGISNTSWFFFTFPKFRGKSDRSDEDLSETEMEDLLNKRDRFESILSCLVGLHGYSKCVSFQQQLHNHSQQNKRAEQVQ